MTSEIIDYGVGSDYCKLCMEQQLFDQPSTYTCKHCQISMCNECFHQHTYSLLEEYNLIQNKFNDIALQIQSKQQLLNTFRNQCMKSVDQCFDELIQDIHSLRKECTDHINEQYNKTKVTNKENLATILTGPLTREPIQLSDAV
ncbi:unnamed protein product [Didymodactylos carnosus]|uniref:Uncharacterized protein n=1 Tax=Didymodactylos carnosus TaxID=1234261 RepID=A0A816D2F7_9BILA|nr:unnamed protein product [Didymodactylos carnosus]CAF4531099.1 unnamed protein product [Didymodactylos carnosus]